MITPPRRSSGPSLRTKLALSYAGFLVVAGIALFAVGVLLLRFVPEGNVSSPDGSWAPNRSDLFEVFVRYAGWAIALLIVFGLIGGWLLAGFVLRPLDRITRVARRARDGRLDSRVALPGPRDELTDLADALDTLLDRVEQTIEQERRFAANASHELRTPHSIIRTIVEVARADPSGRDIEAVLERIGTTNDRAIASTESLLLLARIGRGDALQTERVDLTALARSSIQDAAEDAAARDIRVDALLDEVGVSGHGVLLGRLAANLIGNAIEHNVHGGWMRVIVSSPGTLVVENGGAVISAEVARTLVEPFVRAEGRSRSGADRPGVGLGLAIVAAIVRAHDGTLSIAPMPGGGLHVRVDLTR